MVSKDKRKEYDTRYKEKNKDKIIKQREDYYKINKEKINKDNRERFYKRNFGGMRDIVLERDNWKCQECGMSQEQHIIIFNRSLTIHHKIEV
jgi:ribosomal protein S27AE